MRLSVFRNLHAGQAVAILANGASILDHDLGAITCPTIGTNRSFDLHWPTYHIVIDKKQDQGLAKDAFRRLADEGRLFVAGAYWKMGTKIPFHLGDLKFSRDLEKDGVVESLNGVGSIAYSALQLAAFLGFSPIYFLGLDLHGDHFHKEWKPSPLMERQNDLFDQTPSDLAVINVGSPETRCRRFPKVAFAEVWPTPVLDKAELAV